MTLNAEPTRERRALDLDADERAGREAERRVRGRRRVDLDEDAVAVSARPPGSVNVPPGTSAGEAGGDAGRS